MNWLNKLERKFAKYAIPNLIVWLIGAYTIGFFINMMNPNLLGYLNFQPAAILHGQIWRIVTWIFQPTDSNILFLLIMMLFYYQLGTALEHAWGTFRFNAYIFGGMLLTVVGSLIVYALIYLFAGRMAAYLASELMGQIVSTNYINMSIFLAFATLFPDMTVMLYFIIPIKMKWMAGVYFALIVFNLVDPFRSIATVAGTSAAFYVTAIMFMTIALSLCNFLIFFFSTRNMKHYSPHEVHRRQQFKKQMSQPRPESGIAKHRCAVCGRT